MFKLEMKKTKKRARFLHEQVLRFMWTWGTNSINLCHRVRSAEAEGRVQASLVPAKCWQSKLGVRRLPPHGRFTDH